MTLSYPEQKKFAGLFAQRNSFDLPEGAMEEALNVVISNDDTVTKARGFYQYYDPGSDTLVSLFFYQGRLLAVFADEVAYFADTGTAPNKTGSRTNLTGAAVAVTGGRVSRSLEQNGNLYFSTDNGIMKIDAYDGAVFQAGAPPGLDLRGQLLPENGPINGDSQVAYRVLFGRRDINDNLILGAPSDILILTNGKVTSASYTSTGSGPYTVTVTSAGHNLATGMSITVSNATSANADGTRTVTVTSTSQFTFTTTANPASGTLDYVTSRVPLLEFSVPSDITSASEKWFFQLYRTSQSVGMLTSPEANFRLLVERQLTAGEIASRIATYSDEIDEVLVEYQPELYTNPNSREGETQANTRPPLAEDLDLFQGYAFYANCRTRHVLALDLVDAQALSSGDQVVVRVGSVDRTYVARTGVGNQTVRSQGITNAGGDLRIDYVAHNLANGDTVYIDEVTGGSLTAGTYYVVSAATDHFKISLTSGGSPVAHSSVTSLYFQGVTNGTHPIFALLKTGGSVAAQLRTTAQGLVKAINRDSGSLVYASYISAISDTPGRMRLAAKGFTDTIFVRASSLGAGEAFSPELPASFTTGTQVFSQSDRREGSIFVSKLGEPEAVPIVNELVVGSRSKAILRILALRDSVIVLKEDGIWKVTGDSPANFAATALDNTVIAIAPNAAARLNNQVYLLSNQGVCVATDSAVEIVSRRIENLIDPVTGLAEIDDETGAVGYDSDRTYRISTIAPNQTSRTVTYSHNTINDTWTTSGVLFKGGVVGPADTLYLISADNKILRERKTNTKLDWTGQNHAVTVVSVASDALSAVVTSPTRNPEPGDVILKGDVFSTVRTAESVAGANFLLTFAVPTTIEAGDSLQLYERIKSRIVMAPFHAGAVGRQKQFSQLQVRTRTQNVTRLLVSFQSQSFGGSESTLWEARRIASSAGWGYLPWGFFPWGLAASLDVTHKTGPALPIRLLVPRFAQRTSFIQAVLEHSEGGEPLEVQALCWTVRGYKERVSR